VPEGQVRRGLEQGPSGDPVLPDRDGSLEGRDSNPGRLRHRPLLNKHSQEGAVDGLSGKTFVLYNRF